MDYTKGRNFVLNSGGVLADGIGSEEGSRREYAAIDLGWKLPIENGAAISVSFDLYMVVKTASPALIVYNTNNWGPHREVITTRNVLAGETHAVGDLIDKRIKIEGVTLGSGGSEVRTPHDYLEFYSTYGSNNFFRISNLKLELGSEATTWRPAPEDVVDINEGGGAHDPRP